jgi:hypothetical protein
MTASRTIGYWLACWVLLVGYYFLLVAKPSWAETSAAIVGAALAATAVLVTKRAGELRFQVRAPWLARLGRLPWRVLADSGLVLAALWRQLIVRRPVRGSFRTIPFDPGGQDPASAGRRALVIMGMSLAPNSYVVGMDRERGLLLVHQLVSSPQPPGRGDRELPL